MANEVLNIGVVGAGGMGTVHINNYARIDGCRVAAVCDEFEEACSARAAECGASAFPCLADMLAARPDIDVVDVCTPTFMHKQHVTQALSAGKHVICEKPLALTKADAAGMIALAEQNGVQLFVAHVLQYSPEAKVLRGLVESGEYGRPLEAEFLRLSARPRWVKNGWLFDRSKSGLLPFDLHIHDLDLIVSLFGAPTGLDYLSGGNPNRGHAEFYRFLYDFDDGPYVVAEAAWYNADIPFTATWRVYFENAIVINDGKTVTAYQFDHEPRVFDTEEKLKIPTGINVPPTGMYYAELSDFLAQIRAGGKGCKRKDEILAVLGILETIQ